jgi:hypothetical protein
MAPTTQVLQGDAPEEILPVFHDFDAYNDAAVTALGALGVDTNALGPTEAGELAAVDPRAPEKFPDPESFRLDRPLAEVRQHLSFGNGDTRNLNKPVLIVQVGRTF